MIESVSVTHHIQKHILDVLMYTAVARFRDLRPPRTDTNLFTYHLNVLYLERKRLIVRRSRKYGKETNSHPAKNRYDVSGPK